MQGREPEDTNFDRRAHIIVDIVHPVQLITEKNGAADTYHAAMAGENLFAPRCKSSSLVFLSHSLNVFE